MYYKKGDILGRIGVVGVFKTAKVVSDATDGYYALEVLEATKDVIFTKGEIIVRSEETLDDFYEKVDSFFKVGVTYKYKPSSWRDSTLRFTVLETYFLDNPIYADSKDVAVIKMVDADNEEAIVVLDANDFKNMDKV